MTIRERLSTESLNVKDGTHHAGGAPDVLHEELFKHDVPESLVVDGVHLLSETVVGDLYDGMLDVLAVVEADLFGVAYDSRMHKP